MNKNPKPRKSHKSRSKTPAASRRADPQAQGINTTMHADAAGIDVGAEEFVAAVPPGRAGADESSVRTFTTFTSGVAQLRDWLLACGIKTAAMEPSGAR